MKILLCGTSFLPAYGGPARSVSRLADALADAGVDVGLWSADESVMTTRFLREKSQVKRLGGTPEDALVSFGTPDVLHDNGIWLPHHHKLAAVAEKHGIPRVVSTRGMLEPWAMNHKRLKKRLAWMLYQRRDLRRASCHHVTSAGEESSVLSKRWAVPVVKIPNGVDLPGVEPGAASRAREKTLLFIGRIYPVKGLPLLAQAWAKVRPAGWKVRIVGPDEAGHQAEVEALVSRLGISEDFCFEGELDGPEKAGAFANASVFVLPSHTENFGMALAEALAHGLPAIATQGTPWSSLEENRCGWWCPTSVEGLASAIEGATRTPAGMLQEMGTRARDLMRDHFSWESVANNFSAVYRRLASTAITP